MKHENVARAAEVTKEIEQLEQAILDVSMAATVFIGITDQDYRAAARYDINREKAVACLTHQLDTLKQEARSLGVTFEDDIAIGQRVTLMDEEDSIVPSGDYVVAELHPLGGFMVEGHPRVVVHPHRVIAG